jgi:hypothetical protein
MSKAVCSHHNSYHSLLSQSPITVHSLCSCYQLIVMTKEAPEQPQIATEPPAAPLQYCITGSQYVKGGEMREVCVVKYPHVYIHDAGEREINNGNI